MSRTFVIFAISLTTTALTSCVQPARDVMCSSIEPNDLYISEVLANPEGTDSGYEYIELYNATSKDLELIGLSLAFTGSESNESENLKEHLILNSTVSAYSYFAIGDADSSALPPYLDGSYGSDLGALRNEGGTIDVRCTDKVLAVLDYGEAESGKAWQASASDLEASIAEPRFCLASVAFEGTNYGSPGAENETCTIPVEPGQCREGMVNRPINKPAVEELYFSEWMADPAAVADSKGEWFEIRARTNVDLNGLSLGTAENPSQIQIESEDCVALNAGEHLLFAKSLDASLNGGLSDVYATFSFSLLNTNGSLRIMFEGDVIDALDYVSANAGKATQIDEEDNVCVATTVYGLGDLGTPGTENPSCL